MIDCGELRKKERKRKKEKNKGELEKFRKLIQSSGIYFLFLTFGFLFFCLCFSLFKTQG